MTYEEGVIAIAAGLLSGIEFLHKHGLVHRDIKPSNVLLAASGHPYLIDFNLAARSTDILRLAGTPPTWHQSN